ncbi:ABC transporter permease [Dyadobacter sp. NIV53]|uniref:ABC transporter permease n=1 Tax=Dyadobacter sp. NIV53 TaxID=2861765 RepID=UPI001C86D721|nr:ABC transporter permease [Dyadobacter sp. NIV53]
MLKNYLKIALRNLVKNKGYSAINIGGLAVGMAVAMLIGLWIYDELSFNKSFSNYSRIAQVTEQGIEKDGKRYSNNSLPYPLANELKVNYRQYFEHILLAYQPEEYILTSGETVLTRKGEFIEAGAPEMLTLNMLKGTRAGLKDPHSILLSASAATALFGDSDPIDKPIRINKDIEAKVTGVYEDLPHNSEFHDIKFLAPFDLYTITNPWVKEQQWDNWFLSIYAQIKPGEDFGNVSRLIKDIEINHIKNLTGSKEQIAKKPQIALLPMSRWHLYGGYYMSDTGPVRMVWLIGLIGAFVLLLACINFMNLSTARSIKRAKEVGIRKAIGSQRGQLAGQFLSESFLIVILSLLLSIILVIFSLTWFNGIAGKQLIIPCTNFYFWLTTSGFIILTGFLAGSYPAIYLSSFQPVKVLKGTITMGRFAAIPRKVLIVLQFTVSVTLIIGTLLVYRQIQFAKNRPVGYNKESLLLVEKKTADFKDKYELLRNELKNTGVVSEVAQSRSSATGITMWNGGFSRNGSAFDCPTGCGTLPVSIEYGNTIGWQFKAGRDFGNAFATDSAGFIINESFARLIGLKNPVGESIVWGPGHRKPKTYTILGVVKDMVALSPYEATVPTVFFLEDNYTWINIRLDPSITVREALPKIEAVFKKIIPAVPFDYRFADQEYAAKFAAEERIGKLASFLTILAVFISCLGLFGLASFTAEQRVKEIGIRKVLGASVANLWALLSGDFVLLVVISCLISIPIAYYFLNDWLLKYQYRTEMSWWIFAAAGFGAMAITLITVSYQAIKAALMNPVKSLKTE